ncbi:hypothetical protein L873DRAFT_1786167 [Choiromyces venosus 120613-1]|uniref:PiggyBac transposable element-derived protein domain-containing protein n=1 Tax=Choiromyces venosus 120613-1 TaxID=1336337 RepID=A0A3N4K309_9PEZI|nr:hypothetical protein L873DRAFT_1786167 [Choiromyces venosus 120613-1]
MIVGDLKIWFGIFIHMGITSIPALQDYWKHDSLHPAHPITAYMPLNKFQQIKCYLHTAAIDIPKTTEGRRRLWYGKVDLILDQLYSSSQALHLPSPNVSIDEAMIRCIGHSQDTYKMPNKPIKLGFKFHCLVNHVYI